MIVVTADGREDQRNGTACQQGIDDRTVANHDRQTRGQAGAHDYERQVEILNAGGSEDIRYRIAHPDRIDEAESPWSWSEYLLKSYAARQLRHLLGREASRVAGTDNAAHAHADHQIDRQVKLFNDLEHADVGKSAC